MVTNKVHLMQHLHIGEIMFKLILSLSVFLSLFQLSNCGGVSKGDSNVENQSPNNMTTVSWALTPQIKNFAFSNFDSPWLVTAKGEFLHTQDGGLSWKRISKDIITNPKCVSFIDPQRGWVVNEQGQVWSTSDGGNSWISVTQIGANDRSFYTPVKMLFTDQLHGWIIDTFSVWGTKDGGINWKQYQFARDENQKHWQPTDITFINPSTGWISATYGIIHRTTDGGVTWHTQSALKDTNMDVREIHFINERTGWIIGSPNIRIYRSDDGGASWQQQLNEDKEIRIHSIYFVDVNEGWAVGQKSLEGNSGYVLRDIENKKIQGIVLHTLDGGKSWQSVQITGYEPFFDGIYFFNSQHGWLFARDNVYRTDNAGKDWRISLSLLPIK